MSASVTQYVLKVSSRCDLACDHCYVYEHADQSWRDKPKAMDATTVVQAARRIAEHAGIHQLGEVHVVLHGGEPLLLGHDGLHEVISTLRSFIDPVTSLDLRIHTNGVRLDEKLCALFADYAVQVGVSLDGDRAANDRHRRFSDDRSSHAQVRQALSLLRKPDGPTWGVRLSGSTLSNARKASAICGDVRTPSPRTKPTRQPTSSGICRWR